MNGIWTDCAHLGGRASVQQPRVQLLHDALLDAVSAVREVLQQERPQRDARRGGALPPPCV
jgi:hypothetical protein